MALSQRFAAGTCLFLWACGTTDPGKLDASVDASSTPTIEDAGVEDAQSDAYSSDGAVSPLTK